jgi:DNA-binding transcriptional ArsR family regulator
MQVIFDHDRIFSALADATRRDIVRRAIDGEEGVAELAEPLPDELRGVQKHVAILERAGLVTKQRIGRRKVVRTNVEGLRVAQRLLDRYEQLWRDRFDRMTELISQSQEEDPVDRHRRPQGPQGPDHDDDRRVRRVARARVAAVGRSAPARALVGPADLPRHLHEARPAPGSRVEYHMTGPEGDQPRGYWDVVETDPPRRLVFRDGFANDDGTPNDEPAHGRAA